MKSRILTLLLTLCCSMFFLIPANANAENLGTCFVDSLNGKEKKSLAKWMFFSMASHPELQSYANISAEDISASDSFVAALITRLFVEDCTNEVKTAQQSDPQAIKKAFEFVGKVAMQELMTNQAVKTAITQYAKQIDQEKIRRTFAK